MTFFASSLRCREPLDISMARLIEAYRSHPVTPIEAMLSVFCFFPTCQVRVVRFYVSCLVLLLLLLSSPPPLVVLLLSLSSSSRCPPRPPAQLRPAIHSVLCRTSTTTIVSAPCRTSTMTIHALCSLPDLNHDHPRPVFPAGPQPRPSPSSVPCRTSTASIHITPSVPCRTASIHAKCSLPDLMRYAR